MGGGVDVRVVRGGDMQFVKKLECVMTGDEKGDNMDKALDGEDGAFRRLGRRVVNNEGGTWFTYSKTGTRPFLYI